MNDLHLVPCTPERHAGAILDIFNHAIATSTALYDYHPRPPEQMAAWFASKHTGNLPVLGLEDAAGTCRASPATDRFAHSRPTNTPWNIRSTCTTQRGRGLGRQLMHALIAEARTRGNVHALVGAIDAANTGSRALHEKLGFALVGSLPQVAFKFGGWLDLVFYQLLLETPLQPVDG
jgi:phosphinothricin acetyltransferase